MKNQEKVHREKTATELNNVLWDVITGLEDKTLKTSEAKEMTNAAGKIIQLCQTQLQANQMGASVAIDLLELPEGSIQLAGIKNKARRIT